MAEEAAQGGLFADDEEPAAAGVVGEPEVAAVEEEEEVEVSEEQRTAIIQSFITQAPPGELLQVANDVRALINDDALLNKVAGSAFRRYNIDQAVVADLPEAAGKVVICERAEVDPSSYLVPASGVVAVFDHIKQECTSMRPAVAGEGGCEEAAEPFRIAMQAALEPYVSEYYPDGACAVFASSSADGGVTVEVVIASGKFNPSNFWNGWWRSTWRVQVDSGSGEGSATVVGSVKVGAHYYEEGNVQLSTSHECATEAVSGGDATALGSEVAKAVKKAEDAFAESLREAYNSFSLTTFKELRRKLPVTRQKFPWGQAVYKLAGAVTGGEVASAANLKAAAREAQRHAAAVTVATTMDATTAEA